MQPGAFSDAKYQPFEFVADTKQFALLVHGFPGTPNEMRLVGKVLHSLGYTAKGILLPGFGSEIDMLGQMKREDWIKDVSRHLEHAREHFDEIILVGYSFGAAVLINTIIEKKYVGISKLILLAPFWNVFGSYNLLVRIFGPLVWPIGRLISPDMKVFESVDFSNPNDRKELERTFDGLDLDDPSVQRFIKDIKIPFSVINELYITGRLAKRYFETVKIPILVLQGSNDKVVPARSTRKLIARSSNIKYIEIDHLDHHFVEPEQNNDDLMRSRFEIFLSR